MTLIILAQTRNFFLTLIDEKQRGESVFYRLAGFSKLSRMFGHSLIYWTMALANIGIYFVFCWIGWGSVEIFETPVKILSMIAIFVGSESNYVHFLSKIKWLRNGRHKALFLSNVIILIPNLLVLFFHGFEGSKLLGAAAFLFPGSALIGLIMQEKSPFIFSGKLMFMLILSFALFFLFILFKKIYRFVKRRKSSKRLWNLLSYLTSQDNNPTNRKTGILVPSYRLSKFSQEAKEISIDDLKYFPPFNFPQGMCFREVIEVIQSTKAINESNFAKLPDFRRALHIDYSLMNVRFEKMDPTKLVAFKVLFVVLISPKWVLLHEKILGNSVSDFIDFQSDNNIIVLTADHTKTLFFDHIYEQKDNHEFILSDSTAQVHFLSKSTKDRPPKESEVSFIGQYRIKPLKYKSQNSSKEKWFVSPSEYKLFEEFSRHSVMTADSLKELIKESELLLRKRDIVMRIFKMKFEFLKSSFYLLLTPMISFFCFVLYFKSINIFQVVSNKPLLDKEVSIANFYSITNFNLYFVLNIHQFRKFRVNKFFTALISPRTFWIANFCFDYAVFVAQNIPRVIYASLTLPYQSLQSDARAFDLRDFYSAVRTYVHRDLLCLFELLCKEIDHH